jgi:hypothetical protein
MEHCRSIQQRRPDRQARRVCPTADAAQPAESERMSSESVGVSAFVCRSLFARCFCRWACIANLCLLVALKTLAPHMSLFGQESHWWGHTAAFLSVTLMRLQCFGSLGTPRGRARACNAPSCCICCSLQLLARVLYLPVGYYHTGST